MSRSASRARLVVSVAASSEPTRRRRVGRGRCLREPDPQPGQMRQHLRADRPGQSLALGLLGGQQPQAGGLELLGLRAGLIHLDA